MNYKNILLSMLATVALISYVPSITAQGASFNNDKRNTYDKPINLIPMYGYPDIEKTAGQKKADEEFIRTVVANSGSQVKGAREFAAWGWAELRKGNPADAMRRFNQSWLLDPNYYQPYWGFGALLLAERKPAIAAMHFEKALTFMDEGKEKARLLVDTAKAYAWQGSAVKKTDPVNSDSFYKKASSLIEKAFNADPKYGKAYRYGALIYFDRGDYRKTWEIVKKARTSGSYNFAPKFINALSEKMPEPK